MSEWIFENSKRVQYGEDGPSYIARCSKCCQFVRAPDTLTVPEDGPAPDAESVCSRCGPTTLICEGYV